VGGNVAPSLQVFWASSILVAAPVLLYDQGPAIPGSHTEILSGAAAVGSMFAELFMIQSLLVFDPIQPTAGGHPGAPTYNRRAVSPSFFRCSTAEPCLSIGEGFVPERKICNI
jgi:hypothetical protein